MKNFLLIIALLLMPATSHGAMTINQDQVSIPLNEVNDGKAHYYSLEVNGIDIKFFVLKSRDGVIRAAFDACDFCYRSKKGFSQNGDFMTCNNCGMRFKSTLINVVQGGCNPAPLARTTAGNKLVIKIKDIKLGAKYF